MNKKKILVAGDTTTCNSGFAGYNRALLKHLHARDDVEVAEFAFNGYDAFKKNVEWKYYPTCVTSQDEGWKEFTSHQQNKWGRWRWEKVLLHFRPDVVVTVADPYQTYFMIESPLRRYHKHIICATVDSEPQKSDYLYAINEADYVTTYSEYGKNILEKNGILVDEVMGMGVDLSNFAPVSDKPTHKLIHGIPADSIVFGFVARNQIRKRIPELLKAFKLYLESVPQEIANKSFLYLHTTHPDKTWHLPKNLIQTGLWNKVYFTYKCTLTGQWFSSLYHDKFTYSPFSNQVSGMMVNVMEGITDKQLNEVYNMFDCYIQAATNEGFGAPMIEAASAGLPVIGVDYSAMSEIISKLGGRLLKPEYFFEEPSTLSDKAALPISSVVSIFKEFAENPAAFAGNYRENAQQFSWESCLEKWTNLLLREEVKGSWDAPYRPVPIVKLEGSPEPAEFISQIALAPWSLKGMRQIENLQHKSIIVEGRQEPYTPEMVAKVSEGERNNMRNCELIRVGKAQLKEESWL